MCVMRGGVCRGADCNTDHRLVRAKLVVGRSVRSFKRASGRTGMKRWDVAKLQGACVDEMGRVTARGRFLGGYRGEVEGEMGQRQQCGREVGCLEVSDV